MEEPVPLRTIPNEDYGSEPEKPKTSPQPGRGRKAMSPAMQERLRRESDGFDFGALLEGVSTLHGPTNPPLDATQKLTPVAFLPEIAPHHSRFRIVILCLVLAFLGLLMGWFFRPQGTHTRPSPKAQKTRHPNSSAKHP